MYLNTKYIRFLSKVFKYKIYVKYIFLIANMYLKIMPIHSLIKSASHFFV